MHDETIDFLPAPYPMHGQFSIEGKRTFHMLLVGWENTLDRGPDLANADGSPGRYYQPVFMETHGFEVGTTERLDMIGENVELVRILPGFPRED
jgi:hypothetical protein